MPDSFVKLKYSLPEQAYSKEDVKKLEEDVKSQNGVSLSK